jgi:hypothetical protein
MRALGASAVACTTPVNAGLPVEGSSRWWAGVPLRSSQLRLPIPLVAAPVRHSSNVCRIRPSNGL